MALDLLLYKPFTTYAYVYIYIYTSHRSQNTPDFFPGCPSVASNEALWPDLYSYCCTTLRQVQAEVRTPHSRGW